MVEEMRGCMSRVAVVGEAGAEETRSDTALDATLKGRLVGSLQGRFQVRAFARLAGRYVAWFVWYVGAGHGLGLEVVEAEADGMTGVIGGGIGQGAGAVVVRLGFESFVA